MRDEGEYAEDEKVAGENRIESMTDEEDDD